MTSNLIPILKLRADIRKLEDTKYRVNHGRELLDAFYQPTGQFIVEPATTPQLDKVIRQRKRQLKELEQ